MSLSKKVIEKRYNCRLEKCVDGWILFNKDNKQLSQAKNLDEIVENIKSDILLISNDVDYVCNDFLMNYCGLFNCGINYNFDSDNKFCIYYVKKYNVILKFHTYKLYNLILKEKHLNNIKNGIYKRANDYIKNCSYGYIHMNNGHSSDFKNLNTDEIIKIFSNNIKPVKIEQVRDSVLVEYLKSDINHDNKKRDYPQCIGEKCRYYYVEGKECCLGTFGSGNNDSNECFAPAYIQGTSMKLDEVEKWLRIIEKYNEKGEWYEY